MLSAQDYVGRYAPSPTGPLHLGSLLAALASYLEARSRGGCWRLRIDDLDTPRVVPGAADRIIDTLAAYGLEGDGEPLYQSTREAAYRSAVSRLRRTGYAFDCGCTRREALAGPVGPEGPIYPGTCRNGLPPGRLARSVRSRVMPGRVALVDRVQGSISQDLTRAVGDFVIRRADGITAYQLATVIDDAFQGVTDVVRGADLLYSTPRQMYLQRCLGLPQPGYAHVPVLVDTSGQKLGKSTGALALGSTQRAAELSRCLTWLGQVPPEAMATWAVADVIAWAVEHWRPGQIPSVATLSVD